MSRGLGQLQHVLATIRRIGKPMTFADIRAEALGDDHKLSASFERSMRRALHRLVSEGILIAIGDGGPSDPFRYFFHPIGIALVFEKPEADALYKALEADSGAEAACARLARR